MLLEWTSIIWYEIGVNDKNERVFENFNTGKIELTGSELIKGVFMNPDNYLETDDSGLSERLKTQQIMMGAQWDEIEKGLHKDEFWDFIPHLEDANIDLYTATRIDSIFDIFVFFNEENFGFEDPLFSFKKINKMIYNSLKNINNNEQTLEKRTNLKFKIMSKQWSEIMNIHNIFNEWYNGYPTLENKNSLYHRISLFKYMMIKNSANYKERYRRVLREFKELYMRIIKSLKTEYLNIINNHINKLLNATKSEDISNIICSTNYNDDHALESLLIAFNLAMLENAKAYGGRFPFNIYKNKKWEKEHIFASQTILSGMDRVNKDKLVDSLVSITEIEAFKNYNEFINGETIGLPKNYESLIEIIHEYKNNIDPKKNVDFEEKLFGKDGLIINHLYDNNLGNMSLLVKKNNIQVSNHSFIEKSKIVRDKFRNGEFIPICTMNVYCDFYDENPSIDEYWLYKKRLPYLKEMIDAITQYLYPKESDTNE
jgi:hypothetical protein